VELPARVDSKEVYADDIIRLLANLPLVIEFSDEPHVIDAVLHLLESKLGDRIVLWNAHSR
jgi:PII-like signaling protein